jgi:transcriptional regulator with XRE-family HTH domain
MNGQKLRLIREFRNYSQKHVAGKLGISQNAYSRIECNQTKITTERLRQLADLFKVPLEELLSEKDAEIHFSFSPGETPTQGKDEHWSKDEKIAFLESEIDVLRKERDRIFQVIERLTS